MTQTHLRRSAYYLALLAVTAGLVSIAASHVLLALALAVLLLSGQKLRLPPVWLPLALFALGTVVSILLSPRLFEHAFALAQALAEEDGGRGGAVRDDIDVHGHILSQIIEQYDINTKYYMGT